MRLTSWRFVLSAGAVVVVVAFALMGRAKRFTTADSEATCGPGFVRTETRCCALPGPPTAPGVCPIRQAASCPPHLVATARGCDRARDDAVLVGETSVLIGPSDWEAEGRVAPRTVRAGPFRIDRFEVTVGNAFCPTCPLPRPTEFDGTDPGRAAAKVTLTEAETYCRAEGGRLPTEDEWIVAAAGDRPRRYPWGDTGAVCRRAAWGLSHGPCGAGATAPDSVGAHPDGATPLGIQDLAGNVAEWVAGEVQAGGASAIVRGGSFETALATDLRTWPRAEVPASERRANIGFRCAYDVALR